MTSREKPRRFSPTRFSPLTSSRSATMVKGAKSREMRARPPTITLSPTRTNWCTPAPPPRKVLAPTLTWPASITLFASTTSSEIAQSCPVWLLAMRKQRAPTVVASLS